MLSLLRSFEQKPVGLDELRQAAPPWCKVQLYAALPSKGTIQQYLGKHKAVIVLYLMHSKSGKRMSGVGHYAAVLRRRDKIEYFSSYGLAPEVEIHATHSKGRLIRLLGKSFTHNKVQLQGLRNSNTCARWAFARVMLIDLPVHKFIDLLRRSVTLRTADDVVAALTMLAIL